VRVSAMGQNYLCHLCRPAFRGNWDLALTRRTETSCCSDHKSLQQELSFRECQDKQAFNCLKRIDRLT